MRRPAAGLRFYRLTATSPPTEQDFVPQGQRPGYRIRRQIEPKLLEAIMHGLSVFDAERGARAQNDVFTKRPGGSPFRFVTTLDVPADSSITCDDAFGSDHHWDLYGTAADIMRCVTAPDREL